MARSNAMPRDDQSGIVAHAGFATQTYGTPQGYRTVVTANTAFPAIAGGANLAVGKKAVSLPAGARLVEKTFMSLAMKQTQGNVTADTPDIGIGTTIGSGVEALLSGVGAAAENILTGQTAADCNGTATVANMTTQLVINAADSHDIYVNVADGWAASGDAALALSGMFEFVWR